MLCLDEIEPIDPARPVKLKSGMVDLWCFFYEQLSDESLLAAYRALLSADEHARYERIYFEHDRRMFLATRALVRTVLSEYGDISPTEWCFERDVHGKPRLSAPSQWNWLHFNLSNTRGLVVCAVSTHPQLGVDAEGLLRPGTMDGVWQKSFSAPEIAALNALPSWRRRERFLRYWTLKESYLKARGVGLTLPLDEFSILLGEADRIGIAFDPRLDDEPSRWMLIQAAAHPHMIGLCVNTCGAGLVLRASNFVPLRGVVPFVVTDRERAF
jgi:4'-phosphopantetheinyl transferase